MLDRLVIVREGGERITTTMVGPLDYPSALDLVASYEGQERVLCEIRELVSPHAHGAAREARKTSQEVKTWGLWKCGHGKTYAEECIGCNLDPNAPDDWKTKP